MPGKSCNIIEISAKYSIEEYTTNANSNIGVNYVGYQAGTTQFRDFYVYNGKQGTILSIIGSTSVSTFNGKLLAGSGTNGSGTNAALLVNGDVCAYRASNTGVYYFGSGTGGSIYLYYDSR